ncbi:MAG TPA: hypothetical protein G4O07_09135 [Dehalococcoidia bacterium]|nr:hypothetical protein [Dehalococcoidia bacterium]
MLVTNLPDDIRKIGRLVRLNVIHRTMLAAGNTGINADLKFGDMTKVPWWRQPEDDVLVTAAAMLAELYRRDSRGLIADRSVENKIVVTCRYVAILMASILKSKDIPTRVRSGNAAYFDMGDLGNVSADHWINQYWHEEEGRWVTIDADGSPGISGFDPFDMPENVFDFPARAWLDIRAGKVDPVRFYNAKPERGAIVVLYSLFYDYHSLMNNEIIYVHGPSYTKSLRFGNLTEKELDKVDNLACLMLDPDANFEELMWMWETERDFRLLTGGLL